MVKLGEHTGTTEPRLQKRQLSLVGPAPHQHQREQLLLLLLRYCCCCYYYSYCYCYCYCSSYSSNSYYNCYYSWKYNCNYNILKLQITRFFPPSFNCHDTYEFRLCFDRRSGAMAELLHQEFMQLAYGCPQTHGDQQKKEKSNLKILEVKLVLRL